MLINPGDTVGFIYDAGTNPGRTRLVEVIEYKNDYLTGNDINVTDGDKYRKFTTNKIRHRKISVLAGDTEQLIPLTDVVTADVSHLQTKEYETLYNLIRPKSKALTYLPAYKAFLVLREQKGRVKITVENNTTMITFVNKLGKSLDLVFNNNHPASQLQVECLLSNSDMAKFAKDLVNHLGLSPDGSR